MTLGTDYRPGTAPCRACRSARLGRPDAPRFADPTVPTLWYSRLSLREARRPRTRPGVVADAQAQRQDCHAPDSAGCRGANPGADCRMPAFPGRRRVHCAKRVWRPGQTEDGEKRGFKAVRGRGRRGNRRLVAPGATISSRGGADGRAHERLCRPHGGVRLRTGGALRRPPPEDVPECPGVADPRTGLLPLRHLPRRRLSARPKVGPVEDTSLSPATTRMVGLAAAEGRSPRRADVVGAGHAHRDQAGERTAEAFWDARSPPMNAMCQPGAAPTMYLGLHRRLRPSEVEGRRGKQPDIGHRSSWSRCTTAQARDKDGKPYATPGRQLQRRGRERGQPRHRPVAIRLRKTRLSRGAGACRLDLALGGAARHRNRRLPRQDICARRRLARAPACRVGRRPAPCASPRRSHADRESASHVFGRHRMRYPQFRAKGLCVASGVVEAGCQTHGSSTLDRGRRQRHHRPAMLSAQRALRMLRGLSNRCRVPA